MWRDGGLQLLGGGGDAFSESGELFGHVKGSFTGATTDKMGLFEYAHNGTLFLDEIGDMPLGHASQTAARFAESGSHCGSGSLRRTQKWEVRVIAATNHDLRARIAERQFREDLYYRLSMVEIRTPALADRKEDLPPLLVRFFIRQIRRTVSEAPDAA